MLYDTSFDHAGADVPRFDRGVLWALRILAVIAVIAASANAQLPGAPVLQNAWATPGTVASLNVAGGGGATLYAAAFSWTPGFGSMQVSGGAGFTNGFGGGSRGAYGVRIAAPFGGASSLVGFGVFAGIGGGPARTTSTTVSCTVVLPSCAVITPIGGRSGIITFDSTTNTTVIPIGASVGWRQSFGGSRGLSLFASPAFVYYGGGTTSGGLMRVAFGIDAGVAANIGITGGIEVGGTRPQAIGGPSGTVYGLGASYSFGAR